jgi:hypothetical protein
MSQHTGSAQLRGYERDLLPEAACGQSFCGVVQRYGTYYGASRLWRVSGVSKLVAALCPKAGIGGVLQVPSSIAKRAIRFFWELALLSQVLVLPPGSP